MTNNLITPEDRKAAKNIWNTWPGDHQLNRDEYVDKASQIIADARPEPSPDAEDLAKKIAEISYDIIGDRVMWSKEFIDQVQNRMEKEIRPLLTNFQPQSVTLDVEAALLEVYPDDGTNIPEGERNYLRDILRKHFRDASKPTESYVCFAHMKLEEFQKDWDCPYCMIGKLLVDAKPTQTQEEWARFVDAMKAKMQLHASYDSQRTVDLLLRKLKEESKELIDAIENHLSQVGTTNAVIEEAIDISILGFLIFNWYSHSLPVPQEAPKPLPGDSRKEYAEFYPEMGETPKVEERRRTFPQKARLETIFIAMEKALLYLMGKNGHTPEERDTTCGLCQAIGEATGRPEYEIREEYLALARGRAPQEAPEVEGDMGGLVLKLKSFGKHGQDESWMYARKTMKEAADTIVSLSAKLGSMDRHMTDIYAAKAEAEQKSTILSKRLGETEAALGMERSKNSGLSANKAVLIKQLNKSTETMLEVSNFYNEKLTKAEARVEELEKAKAKFYKLLLRSYSEEQVSAWIEKSLTVVIDET